jgi:hypothetical protein
MQANSVKKKIKVLFIFLYITIKVYLIHGWPTIRSGRNFLGHLIHAIIHLLKLSDAISIKSQKER